VAGVDGGFLYGTSTLTGAICMNQLEAFAKVRSTSGRAQQHPYMVDGNSTRRWRLWAYAFHVGAIVWSMPALVAFIIGMIDVRNGIVRLGN